MHNSSHTSKPGIIVMSADTDEQFDWVSDGWNTIKHPNPELKAKANACIDAAKNVPDAIQRLEAAGFNIIRSGWGKEQ